MTGLHKFDIVIVHPVFHEGFIMHSEQIVKQIVFPLILFTRTLVTNNIPMILPGKPTVPPPSGR